MRLNNVCNLLTFVINCMPEITELFENMPTFTKCYVILSLVLGLLAFLKFLPMNLVYVMVPSEIWNPKFLLSFCFLGKLSVGLFFELYFFSLTTGRLEMSYKPNRYPEFFIMILFLGLVCFLLEIVVSWGGYALLSKSFVMSLTYVYCKRNPHEKMMLMYFITCKAAYLPFALVGLEILQGGSIWSSLIGIAAGHLYFYLKDILPVSHRKDFLRTPLWALRFVNWVQNSSLPVVGLGGYRQAAGMNAQGQREFQGRGVRIG